MRVGTRHGGWMVVAGSMAVLVLLASYHLSTKSFWYDEAMSLRLARMAPTEFLAAVANREANGTLYFVALSVWRLLGEGEARVRFLSVLFMAATVPLLYLVGRRHVGSFAAGLAVVLFAINPFVVHYAQEARMYAMALFLVTLAVLSWSHAAETDERRWWLVYGLASVAAVYTHFFSGFVLLGIGITWLLGLAPRTRRSIVTQSAIALAIVPIALFVAGSGGDQISWIGPFSEQALSVVLGSVAAGSLLLAVLLYAAAIIGLRPSDRDQVRRIAPIAAWWLTPFAAGIAISVFRSVLEGRYFIVALPALILLAASGVLRLGAAIRGERAAFATAAVAVAVVAVLAAAPIAAWYTAPRWDWRAAADWVARTSRDGDRIAYIEANGTIPMSQYLRRDTDSPPEEVSIDDLRASTGRAWLVLYLLRGTRYDGLEATLPGYHVLESKAFDGVRVQLIERTG
jgi:mannosyltransferase